MRRIFTISLSIVVVALVLAGCASTQKKMQRAATGMWEYTVYDTPQGDVKGTIDFTMEEDTFGGQMTMDIADAAAPLREVGIRGDTLSFDAQLTVDGTPIQTSTEMKLGEDDTMEGTTTAEGYGSYRIVASRSQ